jgi:hypothetical protein
MRRLVPVAIGVLVVLGGLVILVVVFNSRDSGEVEVPAARTGPGELEPDLGKAHEDFATKELRLSASPPTSGPHPAQNVSQEGEVDDRAILHALELGNVVLVHAGSEPPAALKALQRDVSGPFDPELSAAGQMVILVARSNAKGVQALAWRRRLRTQDPADPALRAFVEAWLGAGAP